MKILLKILWLIWYVGIWFFASVFVLMAYHEGWVYLVLLLVVYWIFYFLGLWFDVPVIVNSSWTMLLGYAIGMFMVLDKAYPNQQQAIKWLGLVPQSIIGEIGLAFVSIFVGVLPVIADKLVNAYKKPRANSTQ